MFLSGKQPTPLHQAEGHEAGPKKVDLDPSFFPESEGSARSQMSSAREPGDLDVASRSMVDGRQLREGYKPRAAAKCVEESDEGIVPKKWSKTRVMPVEMTEGRPEAKGKFAARNASSTQRETDALTYLQRIGQRAKEKPKEKWTMLLSHVKVPLLKEAFLHLRKDAATGVDGMTWEEYGARLGERLIDLENRIHRGSYHPQPVRRVHIPKGDGKTRPIGIPALEDKIVQQAVRMVLEPIYESEFIGFSYGFRPKKSAHDALDALAIAIARKVNWVLDADIRSFFDTIDHRHLQRFIEHRIGDRRMVHLLMRWVNAGVLEEGKLHAAQAGTPQGGLISPLLANVYLHYVFDLWVQLWRKKQARGEMYVVRYADDFVMAFQKEEDVLAMRQALADRLAKFNLELHPDKTRVIEFGRFAREDRVRRGLSKPETFEFLGFVHIASTDRRGKFQLKRQTSRKKRRAKLARLKEETERRRHHRVAEQHAWMSIVLQGHYRYYGVPTNSRCLRQFSQAVRWMWHRSLQRRSQRGRWTVKRLRAFEQRFPLPPPRIYQPWPNQRFVLR
jgi:group II intron reverse transcriptase/maturase